MVVKWTGGVVSRMEEDDQKVRVGVLMWRSSERYGGAKLSKASKVRSRIL